MIRWILNVLQKWNLLWEKMSIKLTPKEKTMSEIKVKGW